MASVATRAPKRDLAPDWRDALRDAVRRFAVRTVGVLLVGVSMAGALALGTHSPTDPSLVSIPRRDGPGFPGEPGSCVRPN